MTEVSKERTAEGFNVHIANCHPHHVSLGVAIAAQQSSSSFRTEFLYVFAQSNTKGLSESGGQVVVSNPAVTANPSHVQLRIESMLVNTAQN